MDKKVLKEKLNQIIQLAETVIEDLQLRNSYQRTPHKQVTKDMFTKARPERLNFSLNERHFIKEYSKGLSKSKLFVLILALMAKGDVKQIKAAEDIKKTWNRLHGLLGGKLNTWIHATRAKEAGWVNYPKSGFYKLSDNWQDIFE